MAHLHDDYIAGMFDGDGSIVMTMVGGAYKSVQLKAELTQCNAEFLDMVRARFGTGVIYKDKRVHKYRKETSACLRFVGAHARSLLDIVAKRGIIKAEQAKLALEFLSLPRGACGEKTAALLRMRELNADKTAYDKDYTRMTDAYVAGLFDAEGNVYQSGTGTTSKLKLYVKITQKSDPELLHKIAQHLGYGRVVEQYRFKMYSHSDVLAFWHTVSPHVHIKKQVLDTLVAAIFGRQQL